jgi:general stress protein CsbA
MKQEKLKESILVIMSLGSFVLLIVGLLTGNLTNYGPMFWIIGIGIFGLFLGPFYLAHIWDMRWGSTEYD